MGVTPLSNCIGLCLGKFGFGKVVAYESWLHREFQVYMYFRGTNSSFKAQSNFPKQIFSGSDIAVPDSKEVHCLLEFGY